jgi:hypothetical protein
MIPVDFKCDSSEDVIRLEVDRGLVREFGRGDV